MTYYAGIGSRSTPPDILKLMERYAARSAALGNVLRSGHAQGADQAFERGAGHLAEIFLPWHSFEMDVPIVADSISYTPIPQAYNAAANFHPNWESCSKGARALHARNCHQILGPQLNDLVTCVICWTPDGSLDGRGPNTGGTGQALRIADNYGVPVYNLARDDHRTIIEFDLSLQASNQSKRGTQHGQ